MAQQLRVLAAGPEIRPGDVYLQCQREEVGSQKIEAISKTPETQMEIFVCLFVCFWFFKTGFLCRALAVLELTL